MNTLKNIGSLLVAALIAFIAGLALATLGLAIASTPTRDERYARSIVKVLNTEGTGGGTGWVTESAGRKVIVTNNHVCAVAVGGYARIESADGTPSVKRILRTSFVRDLCVLEGVDAPSLALAKSGPKRFDVINVMGHPGLRPTAPATGVYTGNGIVPIGFEQENGKCPEGSERVDSFFGTFCVLRMELSYTTVPIMPGNSGSPVTNQDGEVIGVMNSADSTGNQGMMIPLTYVREILAQ